MKKFLFILFAAFLVTNAVFAEDISEEQAIQIASQFVVNSQPSMAKVKGYRAPKHALMPKWLMPYSRRWLPTKTMCMS